MESPTRCPYDNEGRCASVVASRPDSGPSTPIEVAPRLRGRLPDQRALQPYGPWRGMITRGAVLTSASGAPTIGVVDDAVPGRDDVRLHSLGAIGGLAADGVCRT